MLDLPLAALAPLLWQTAGAATAPAEVRVFAAASLTEALSESVTRFRRARPEIRVILQYGGSSDLARQILAGAPADLFFSADERQMDRLAREGLVEESSRKNLLSNQLVIVMSRSSSRPIAGPEGLGASERIALADPEAVPAGVYARLYLEKLGLWNELRRRVVPTLDVRAALAAVASGNVDAGFVYRTDAGLEPRVEVVYEVPREAGPRILYPLAAMRGRAREPVVALSEFLSSGDARSVFERYGFVVLGGEP